MGLTEVTQRGCLENIMGSIMGVVFGVILILIALPLLFWNEGRAVHTAQGLTEGQGAVVDAPADHVDGKFQGQLVHMAGQVSSNATLVDGEYGVVAAGALKLRRTVEMYQWLEHEKSQTRKKLGGGTETFHNYTYSQGWSSALVDSSHFHQPGGHQNPPNMPPGQVLTAHKPMLGAFTLDSGLMDQLKTFVPVPVSAAALPPALRSQAKVVGGAVFLNGTPNPPSIGTVRVSFQAVQPQPVSIVAVQQVDSFAPYVAKAGGTSIEMLLPGTVGAAQMFKQQEESNNNTTWIFRLVGFALMFFGLLMLGGPLVAVANVIPFLGDLLGFGAALFAFAGAVLGTLVVIAIGWIAYRPAVGVLLLIVGVAAFFGLRQVAVARKR